MIRVMMWLIYAMLAFGALCIVYVIAPVLIPLIAVVGGFGFLTWGIVTASKALERRVHGAVSDPSGVDDGPEQS